MFKLVGLTGSASFCVGWFAHEALADRRHARRRQHDIDAWYGELRNRRHIQHLRHDGTTEMLSPNPERSNTP